MEIFLLRQFTGQDVPSPALMNTHPFNRSLPTRNTLAFVSLNSYLVVFDTIVEDLPDNYLPGRAWSRGDNPKTAVHEFLKTHPEFIIDTDIDNKLLVSVAPGGYLKRIK